MNKLHSNAYSNQPTLRTINITGFTTAAETREYVKTDKYMRL